jgi:hypothetical protein
MRVVSRLTLVFGILLFSSFSGAQVSAQPALGEHSLLFLPIKFADEPSTPLSTEAAQALVARTDKEMRAYSYGSCWLNDRVQQVALPEGKSFYDQLTAQQAARAAARAAGQDPDLYKITVYYSEIFGTSHAYPGNAFLTWMSVPTLIHEIGHTIGLPHANSFKFAPGDFLGNGTVEGYGNVYDTMGGAAHYLQPENPAEVPMAHFNSFLKYRLGWLPEANVATVSTNGVYSLASIDYGGLAGHHALRVQRSATEDFWLEVRTGAPNSFNGNGVLIMLCDRSSSSLANQLIDTTPGSDPVWKFNGRGGSDSGKFDAALSAGRSLLDPKSGIGIFPLGWKDGRFDVFVRVSGAEPPPATYYDGLFTWVRPDLFPAGFQPELIFGYNGYFSGVPGKRFVIEDSADLSTWGFVKDYVSDGSVVHFTRELSTFSPRFFRARVLE